MSLPICRLQIIGSSNSGKSTLGARLSRETGYPLVELDALNWEPDWQGLNQHNPEEFRRRVRQATSHEKWIVAGNYSEFSRELIWPKADAIIILDLPLLLLTIRLLKRSWKRWRTKELLWGTNYEKFWSHFKIWSDESLLKWLWQNYHRQRANNLEARSDPRWAHLKFIHLNSLNEINSFEI
ncbi:MAG: adenylate kinase [Verrucomicrobiota bacterium]